MESELLLKAQSVPQSLLSKDKKTNGRITNQFYKNKIRHERNKINALIHNFKPGFLEAEQGEETLKVGQNLIKEIVNVQTAANIFDLRLELGSYRCQYSQNGSSLLLTSSMGHTCIVNWREKTPLLELNLNQNILHSQFLHNDEIFALSQSSATYIYDHRGIELHRLDRSLGIQYLPYHFLLVAYDQRKLRYYDTTTGNVIADHVAKNPYTVMRQNPSNAIIALGSSKGTVQWWTPGSGTPPVKLFVGAGVTDIGFHKGYMVTASENVKIWDSRMLKVLYTYPLARKLNSLQFSQSGLLALNYGFRIDIFKEVYEAQQTHPYMTYKSQGNVNNCRFVPFEDLFGLGTTSGFNCIAVPGSGVPFYDTFENNPFQSKKQKRQGLVHKLLDKLPPQTITIDPNVLGNIDKTKKQVLKQEEQEQNKRLKEMELAKKMQKKRMRGKGSIKNRINRKNIESQKIKRSELTKVINTKLWGKWAQKKKKQKQLNLLEEISQKGLSVAELTAKSKKIAKA